MAKKINFVEQSWTETATTVKQQLVTNFANIASLCTIGNGVLCHLTHSKPHYQLGFVFPLVDCSSGKQETIIYYPEKKAFVHLFKIVKGLPVTEQSSKDTKYGRMQVISLSENEFAVAFSKTIRTVE